MFCIKCGKKLEDDSVFCEYCGTKVEPLEETTEVNINTEEKKEEISEKKEETIESNEEVVVDDTNDDKQEDADIESESDFVVEKENKYSELDAAVADLKPDDLDELIPRKSPKSIIITILVICVLLVCGYLYLKGNNKVKIIKEKSVDYQTIINEYAHAIEKVSSEYLLENELINDFSEIKDQVKYDKHKVSCDNIFINIDGTVYLSECSVDGKKVEETYGKKKNIQTKDAEECYVKHNEDKSNLEFYVDGEMKSVYECEHNKCGLYKEDFEYNSCYDMIAVIEDGSDKYLYNYREAQKLFEKLEEIFAVKKDNKIDGFIIKEKESSKYGYVTTRGSIKVELSYDNLGLVTDGKLDTRGINVESDKVVALKGDKYGIISLSKGKEIVPFSYDFIYLGAKDNYVVKKDKEYILINEKGDKVIDKSYDMIFSFDDLLVVSKDKKLSFIDYKDNKIIDDTIELFVDYKESGANGIYGYNAKYIDGKIFIEVNKPDDSGYTSIKYSYNVKDKKLIKE